jgi:hypothetical protein
MFSGKDLVVNGPLYSMFSKEGKVLYLGKLKQKWCHRKGYALQFETYETVFLRSLEHKLFFIDPPEWCDECYEDFRDDCCCCCSLLPKEDFIFESLNNIHSCGIVYSEK